MGAVLITMLSFVVGLIVCGMWASLCSLGIAAMPVSGNLDGVLGLIVCSGAVVGVGLQIVCS